MIKSPSMTGSQYHNGKGLLLAAPMNGALGLTLMSVCVSKPRRQSRDEQLAFVRSCWYWNSMSATVLRVGQNGLSGIAPTKSWLSLLAP